MDHLLSAAVNYQEHKWLISGDFKVTELFPKVYTQSVLVFSVSGTIGLTTNIMSYKSGREDKI